MKQMKRQKLRTINLTWQRVANLRKNVVFIEHLAYSNRTSSINQGCFT